MKKPAKQLKVADTLGLAEHILVEQQPIYRMQSTDIVIEDNRNYSQLGDSILGRKPIQIKLESFGRKTLNKQSSRAIQ